LKIVLQELLGHLGTQVYSVERPESSLGSFCAVGFDNNRAEKAIWPTGRAPADQDPCPMFVHTPLSVPLVPAYGCPRVTDGPLRINSANASGRSS
jgi:hypothetical protein